MRPHLLVRPARLLLRTQLPARRLTRPLSLTSLRWGSSQNPPPPKDAPSDSSPPQPTLTESPPTATTSHTTSTFATPSTTEPPKSPETSTASYVDPPAKIPVSPESTLGSYAAAVPKQNPVSEAPATPTTSQAVEVPQDIPSVQKAPRIPNNSGQPETFPKSESVLVPKASTTVLESTPKGETTTSEKPSASGEEKPLAEVSAVAEEMPSPVAAQAANVSEDVILADDATTAPVAAPEPTSGEPVVLQPGPLGKGAAPPADIPHPEAISGSELTLVPVETHGPNASPKATIEPTLSTSAPINPEEAKASVASPEASYASGADTADLPKAILASDSATVDSIPEVTAAVTSITSASEPIAQSNEPSASLDEEANKSTADSKEILESKSGEKPAPGIDPRNANLRFPRAVQALYLQPLRRVPQDGIPVCDLQLRSYSVRNLEFFADFALRAAYYLYLPAFGAHPLPRIRERWTVPRDHFIFKKSQENFERVTYRRLIQIKDGHPHNVRLWLAFLQKHQYHGVGMKANVWEWSPLDVAGEMDKSAEAALSHIDDTWSHLGESKNAETAEKVAELLAQQRFHLAGGR